MAGPKPKPQPKRPPAPTLATIAAELRASKPLAPLAERILELVRPYIRLAPRKPKAADSAVGATRFGGLPDLAPGAEWPRGEDDSLLDFICQIDLGAVARRDVDNLLPHDGVLAFFSSYVDADPCFGLAVVHSVGALAPLARPKVRRDNATPLPVCGLDVVADFALPPPWSKFVCHEDRHPSTDLRKGGPNRRMKTLVELPAAAASAYQEIFANSCHAHQHGMLGYERPEDGLLEPAEVMLLRLDNDAAIPYDHVEAAALYVLITAKALAARDWAKAEVLHGMYF